MAKARFISIKWKLNFAFVALGVGLVGIYVLMAKDTFESDKISYVFDSQQSQIESLALEFDQKIEQALVLSQSILATYDFQQKALNPIGQKLFDNQKNLLALELRSRSKNESVIKIEKIADRLPAPDDLERALPAGKVDVRILGDDSILILSTQSIESDEILGLRVLEKLSTLPKNSGASILFLSKDGKILSANANVRTEPVYQEIISDFARERSESTGMRQIGKEEYLISSYTSKFADIRFAAVTPKAEALGALSILFKRSMVFVLFSLFVTVLIALTVSKGLTRSLTALTEAAARIGRGDFSVPVTVKSHDEAGVLSNAFQQMGSEIKRLLDETKDKARMEAELKTASLVQESLLPKQANFQKNHIELSGFYATSTECGGDWWYYFERGQELFVAIADATGHGTPAALITSAARSVFSMIEKTEMSLGQIMSAWDFAIASCSHGRVFMTAQLFRIHTITGEVTFINACHEQPLLMKSNGSDELSGEYVPTAKGTTLGECLTETWVEEHLKLEVGNKLILITDGLFAVVDKEGKAINDRRFLRGMTKKLRASSTTQEIITESSNLITDHRQGTLLPDDITLVAITRRPF